MTVSLKIDGKDVTVPVGTTMLQAAQKLDIDIPTFCDDKHLIPFGACRVCVVEVEGTGRLFASCVTPVSQGMEISTNTPMVKEARESVIELLLTYHPLDCPVCPQSGRCHLQDMAFEHGKDSGRFGPIQVEKKIDYESPLIESNHPRCIQCGKCVRICDEVQGEGELDFVERGFDTVIEPSFGRKLDCEFCGQCIQVCPVGSLYSRIFKHTSPVWELTPVRTTCPFCGVGCTLSLEVKNDRIYHVLGVDDEGSNNDGFLCAKGRFGYEYVGHPDRLTKPLIRKGGELVEATWEEAYEAIVQGLKPLGGAAVGGIASARCTNEENYLFQKLLRSALGSPNVDSVARFGHAQAMKALENAFGVAAPTDSMDDLEQSDLIFALDANVTEDAHIAGLKVLKRVRYSEASLVVANPRKIKLSKFADTHLPMKPGTAVALTNALINVILSEGLEDKEFIASKVSGLEDLKKSVDEYTPEKAEEVTGVSADSIRETARAMAAASSMTILLSPAFGSYIGEDTVTAAANLALVTGNVGKAGSGILPLSEYNNVQGVLDMGARPDAASQGLDAMEMMRAAAAGDLKGLYIMGENPLTAFPDRAQVLAGLEKLQFLVVQDIFLTDTAKLADVVLPATAGPEKDGTFTNTDRRVQRVKKAIEPPAKTRADWKILCELFNALGQPQSYAGAMAITKDIAKEIPAYAGITPDRLENGGLHWPCPDENHPGTSFLYENGFPNGKGQLKAVEQANAGAASDLYPFTLISGMILFHSGTTTKWADGLNELAPEAKAQINPLDAKDLGIADGDRVLIKSDNGQIEAVAGVTPKIQKGAVFVPAHYSGMSVSSLMGYDPARENTVTYISVSKA